ncbi:MAG: UPF0223 family protein [Lactobacillales bacterium]|jgi:uncharacterized protein YktA (UPF0223 family)|nr:UPF0223 family protein [Lactobacillales bacterium]
MQSKNFTYPIDDAWSTAEIVAVVDFLGIIEQANESRVAKELILKKYAAFKAVVPSIAEEKRIDRAFERESGYSIYKTIKGLK